MSVDPPDSGGGAGRRKPKQPFLRRGEGVDRRLNAWKMRGKVVPRPSSAAQHRPSPAKQHQQQGGGSFFRQGGGKVAVSPSPVRQHAWSSRQEEAAPSPPLPSTSQRFPTAPSPPRSGWGARTQPAPPQAQRSPFASASPQHQQPRPPSRSPPPAPNASDLSLELTCDSTLVGIQQQREAALHGRSASASAVELNPADAAPLPPAWSEQLHAVAEGAGHPGEAEGGARTWGRLEREHSLRDVNTLNEKQAEEALELEEFEALERRVRRELGELSVDNGQPADVNTAAMEEEDDAQSSQPRGQSYQEARLPHHWHQQQHRHEEEEDAREGEGGEPEGGGMQAFPPGDALAAWREQPQGGGWPSRPASAHRHQEEQREDEEAEDGEGWDRLGKEARPASAAAQQRGFHVYQSRENAIWEEPAAPQHLAPGGFDDGDTWEEDTAEEEAIAAAQRHSPSRAGARPAQKRHALQQQQQREEEEEAAQAQPPRASALVQSLFHNRGAAPRDAAEEARAARAQEAAEREQVEQLAALEDEIKKFQSERSELGRLKNELQVAAARLESERVSFERQKAADLEALEEQREAAARVHKREKSVLEKQRKALLNMPNKKERAEIEALEAALEKEKKDARAREARQKLTVERLRRQMVELQQRNAELREEVQWHERARLEEREAAEAAARAKAADDKAAAGAADKATAATAEMNKAVGPKENLDPNRADPLAATRGASVRPRTPARLSTPAAEDTHDYSEDFCSDADGSELDGGHASAHPHHHSSRPSSVLRQSKAGMPAKAAASELVYYDAGSDMYRAVNHDDASRTSHASGRVLYDDGYSSLEQSRVSEGTYGQAPDEQRHAYSSHEYLRASGPAYDYQPPVEHRGYDQPASDLPRFEVSKEHFQHDPSQSQGRMAGTEHYGAAYSSAPGAAPHGYEYQPAAAARSRPMTAYSAEAPTTQAGAVRHRPSTGANISSYTETYHASLPERAAGHDSLRASRILDASYESASSAGDDAQERQKLSSANTSGVASSGSRAGWGSASATASLDVGRDTRASTPQVAAGHAVPSQAKASLNTTPVAQDVMIHEVHHPDGKLERMFASGKRSVLFTNGTYKEQLPTGVAIICFTNQDVKRSYPDGRVEYYYAEVDTWHTTHVSGIEVFYFPNRQTEAHQPNGIKQIMFPDRTVRQVQPDGSEVDISPASLLQVLKLPMPAKPERPPQVMA
eukprot:jgi/Tetstr1/428779/TSEL_018767.t1